jgi:tetratricopeptide (TPR) repeat protein
MRCFCGQALVLTLAAFIWVGCGGESKAADAPAAAPDSASVPASASAPSPQPLPAQASPATPQAAFDPDAAYDKAGALAAVRRFSEARQVFEDAARQAPKHGAIAAGVAVFADLSANRISEDVVQRLFSAGQHVNADRWAEAQADVDQAIELAPRYPRALGLRGTMLLEQGKPAEALDAFDAMVRLDPEFAEAHYNRGAAQAALDRFDAAIADFSRAIELRADFWDVYIIRGFTLMRRGVERQSKEDMLAAMDDYNRAHELDPGAVEPLHLRGALYALAEQWAEAEADFTAIIALDPQHQDSYYNRGLAHQKQGRDDRAITDYSKAIELDPGDPKPLINRALLYDKQSRHDLAAADRAKAAAIQK